MVLIKNVIPVLLLSTQFSPSIFLGFLTFKLQKVLSKYAAKESASPSRCFDKIYCVMQVN